MIEWLIELNWTAVCDNLQCVCDFGKRLFRNKRPSSLVCVANRYEVGRNVYALDCARDQLTLDVTGQFVQVSSGQFSSVRFDSVRVLWTNFYVFKATNGKKFKQSKR